MKLSSLLAAKKPVDVPFGDQVLKIEYRPAVLTMEFIQGKLSQQSVEEALLELIATWDLEDENGKPLPLDLESLKLPEAVQGAIIQTATRDTYPNL